MNSPSLFLFGLSAGLAVLTAGASAQPPEIRYLPLADKGVAGETVLKSARPFQPRRPLPRVRYIAPDELSISPQGNSEPRKERERAVEVTLVERSGLAQRDLPLRFGLPIPQGELYQLQHLSLTETGESEKPLPLQAHALALWPDGSIKSALLQTRVDLQAHEERHLKAVYGQHPPKAEPYPDTLDLYQREGQWEIRTGKIRVTLPVSHFSLFHRVETDTSDPRLLASGGALTLEDEKGTLYSSAWGASENIIIERQGPLEATLRAEGAFQAEDGRQLFRYIARLHFYTGSSRVDLSITIVNTALAHEFTDLRSLGMEVQFPVFLQWNAFLPTGADEPAKLQSRLSTTLAQWDETRQQRGGSSGGSASGQAPGSLRLETRQSRIDLAYRDFWQRWPKQLEVSRGRLAIDLLPRLPEHFGEDLPVHLRYPFVEGYHRLKWGMAFTERFSIDFDTRQDPGTLQGAIQTPPLVRLPLSYLAETEAFGPLPRAESELTRLWQRYSDASMEAYLAHRATARQYGYFNWGDWFGERGHNWGNNEYDTSHGFFLQYLFTGEARYFDAAVAAVRHQADVDIVHAYPDPYYLGANVQHSIGHTGISYQAVEPKTWTYQYDVATYGGNGHTWADGMADCWLLTGDPVVMDSLLALGDHLAFAYVPGARTMGNHHRSVGWSLQALAAICRVTSDPLYPEAIRKLAALPIQTWDPTSGIWPYELHPNHAMGQSGILGSSVYNLGILLHGLARYHRVTGDERIPPILTKAADWLDAAWIKDQGWPYGVRADGSRIAPGQRAAANLNPLICPSLAYAAALGGHARAEAVARATTLSTFSRLKRDEVPKEFSIKSYATLETIGLLENPQYRQSPASAGAAPISNP